MFVPAFKRWFGACVAAAALCVLVVPARAATLLDQYSVITFGDSTFTGHANGLALFGGDLNATGNSPIFGSSNGHTISADDDSLVVLGNINKNSNYINVNNGRVRYGGSVTDNHFNLNNASSPKLAQISASDPFTVADLQNELDDVAALSTRYAAMTSTSTFLGLESGHQYNLFSIDSADADGVAVLNISSSDLLSSHGLALSNPSTNPADYLIINVSGTNIDAGSFGFNSNIQNSLAAFAKENDYVDPSKLVWNFYEATSIKLGDTWLGTILAPDATLNLNSHNVWGGVAVNNFTSANGEIYGSASAPPPPTSYSVPTPGAAVGGLTLLAGLAVRRRRRSA